jgi:nucleoid DNA-binding protein
MSDNLTKREIVLKIFTDKGYPQKHIRDSVQLTLDAICDALLSGRDVELRNFGVFQVQVRKQRVGRNPNRPETDVVIPRRAVIKFKAGKELKAKLKTIDLNKPSSGSQSKAE